MEDKKENLIKRPPVVVVMGHVDHGKTTLLDFIRKANVAVREAGGITQHVGAYEIAHKGEKITFLDTPGHEAFSKIRSRGAAAADIAILVVAADESIKPQTEEAISHIQKAEIPYVVAINKMDKPGANPDKVKQDLAKANVLVEGWGGKVPVALVSAKSGLGIDELLDTILLVAEMEELKADPLKPAEGVIIESRRDARRGTSATVVILDGTLKRGDGIIAGKVMGRVKILENFLGEPADALSFSSPAVVLGWEEMPQVGEKFYSGSSEVLTIISEAVEEVRMTVNKAADNSDEEIKLILKADTLGSLEALESTIMKHQSPELALHILEKSIGEISENDAKLAETTGATILAFNVKTSSAAEAVMKRSVLEIVSSKIIYELEEILAKKVEELRKKIMAPKITARLEVLAIFKQEGKKQVIGGRVSEGELEKGISVNIVRRGNIIGTGKILNLQLNRQDVSSVAAGNECGLMVSSDITIAKGDVLESTSEK